MTFTYCFKVEVMLNFQRARIRSGDCLTSTCLKTRAEQSLSQCRHTSLHDHDSLSVASHTYRKSSGGTRDAATGGLDANKIGVSVDTCVD